MDLSSQGKQQSKLGQSIEKTNKAKQPAQKGPKKSAGKESDEELPPTTAFDQKIKDYKDLLD